MSSLFFNSNHKKAFFKFLNLIKIDYSRLIRRINVLYIKLNTGSNFRTVEIRNSDNRFYTFNVKRKEVSGIRNLELWIGYLHIEKDYCLGFKIHLIVSEEGIPLTYIVTPASFHDIEGLKLLKGRIKGKRIIGDRAYNSKKLYEEMKREGKELIAIPKRNGEELNPSNLKKDEIEIIKRKRMIIESFRVV